MARKRTLLMDLIRSYKNCTSPNKDDVLRRAISELNMLPKEVFEDGK